MFFPHPPAPSTDHNIYKYVTTHFLCTSKISVVGCYKQTPVLMVTGDYFHIIITQSDELTADIILTFTLNSSVWLCLELFFRCVSVCVCVFLSAHVWVITWNRQEGKITSRCIFCLIMIIIFKAQILWKIWMLVKNMVGRRLLSVYKT